jgi:hypothetical protein
MNSKSSLSAVAVLLLSACGGGDDGTMPATDAVPANALVSARAFSAYTGALPANDSAEPLSLDGVEPPTSETDEPMDLG